MILLPIQSCVPFLLLLLSVGATAPFKQFPSDDDYYTDFKAAAALTDWDAPPLFLNWDTNDIYKAQEYCNYHNAGIWALRECTTLTFGRQCDPGNGFCSFQLKSVKRTGHHEDQTFTIETSSWSAKCPETQKVSQ
ncbi:hypothetical protein O9K51_00533 [Purpureocillium lavendulum]|uniref:Secreted protein n=1 Tax=Purpureocillium lavendulum TaxID=1247861 RepID=A0AB34G6E7_9HYPO|nr:hypothetical protein O9K51_00533 [Purpureocillium lavendulum]